MISLNDYYGPWEGSTDLTKERRENSIKLLEAVNRLISIAQADGIAFPINPATRTQVSGRRYGGFRPQSCDQGAGHSAHKDGMAIDLFDPANKIDTWCFDNQDKLEECGIYIEHPDATITWSHWGIRPPASGHTVYYP